VSHESSGTKLLPKTSPGTKNGKKWLISIWEANIKWFVDAKVNITKIVLTDTLPKKRQNAIIFEPNDPSEEALHISYTELHQRVCKMANVLREQGVEKEIVFVSIYR
jgi:hypothetical protein